MLFHKFCRHKSAFIYNALTLSLCNKGNFATILFLNAEQLFIKIKPGGYPFAWLL